MAHRFSNDPSEVSARMKLIKGSNTKPELYLFNVLNSARIRFRNHVRIHGISVDALISKRIVIFVDSPFWHLRNDEELGRMSPYWQMRLLRNRQRDRRQRRALRAHGYIVLRFWADRLTSEAVLRRMRAAQVRVSKARIVSWRGQAIGNGAGVEIMGFGKVYTCRRTKREQAKPSMSPLANSLHPDNRRLSSDPKSEARKPKEASGRLGQIFTPAPIAFKMAARLLTGRRDTPLRILDPCTGPGTFVRAMEATGLLRRNDEIDAIDIDSRMVEQCAKLTMPPGVKINFIPRDYLTRFSIPLTFVRNGSNNKHEYRSWLHKAFDLTVPGTANLYVYFMVKVLRDLRPGGRFAAIRLILNTYTGGAIVARMGPPNPSLFRSLQRIVSACTAPGG